MKKVLATFMLVMLVFVFAGQAGTGADLQASTANRCHDAHGKFIGGPNCDPTSSVAFFTRSTIL
jgi:hypothetical protein